MTTTQEQQTSIVLMTADEARSTIDTIKGTAAHMRALLLDLHDREGWRALGYATWEACVTAEFAESRAHLYRLLAAGQVERDLGSPIGDLPESQLRPLTQLRTPEERRDAWEKAGELAGEKPRIAANVQKAVEAVKPPSPATKKCERPGCGRPSVGAFNVEGVLTNLCAFHRDAAQPPAAAPTQQTFADEEIAAAPPPTPAPVLTPLTPAAPALTPLAGLAAGLDLQARKLLAAKRALLSASLALVEQDLERAGPGPTVVIRWESATEAARLFVNAPPLGGAAAMLAFSATVEEAREPPEEAPAAIVPPKLFEIVARKVITVEERISEGRLTGEEPSILARCRSDLDDLADDVNVPTEAYDALSHRIGAAQARLVELKKEAAA